MYLTDYHTHSCCSPDSTARLEDMVRRHAGPASGSCAPPTTVTCRTKTELLWAAGTGRPSWTNTGGP